jgi:uncharacterized membrane protein
MTSLSCILLGLAVLFALTPRWTRPDIYFAVTVQTDFPYTPQARRILSRYCLEVALHNFIALALANLVGLERGRASLLGLGWQIIGASWAVARAHRATAAYKTAPSPVREAALSARSHNLPGGWPIALCPLAFLTAAAIYAATEWDRLPRRIPVHWGIHGADRWLDRTPANVFGFLLLLASTCGVFLLLSHGMLHWSRRISVTGERARDESRFRDGVVWLLIGLQYLVAVPAVLMAFWPEMPAKWVWPSLTLAVIALAVVRLTRIGQGGSRVADEIDSGPPMGDHTPDTAWKWGLVYYNPADPALIVEKRFGLGYTLNFGNRWSWVLTAALLVPAIVTVALR